MKGYELNRDPIVVFFLIPSVVVILVTVAYPFVYNFLISISSMSLLNLRDWEIVGTENYRRVLSDPVILIALGRTLLWTVINLIFHVGIGFVLAVILDKRLPAHNFFRLCFILPWAVPQFISALTWGGMFHAEFGIINHLLSIVGLPEVNWFQHPSTAFAAACVANIWLGFPFMMIVFLSALQSIPKQYYDSARVDGASSFQRLRLITIPLIRPAVIPVIFLGFIWTFNNFNVIWLVTSGGRPYDSTHTLVSYIFKVAFGSTREYAYGAAASVVTSIVLMVACGIILRRLRKVPA